MNATMAIILAVFMLLILCDEKTGRSKKKQE